jgi:alkylation response protein AidB-like acyl-CoA dehydrogenase
MPDRLEMSRERNRTMNFDVSPEDEAFRLRVRKFIEANLPGDIARRGERDFEPQQDDVRRWMKILNRQGWAVPVWPVEHGGTGWTPLQKFIFQQELRRARAPVLDRVGTYLLAPVLYTFGSEKQKAELLPRIRNGDDWWAQGFSEPGSGSDLASLRTRAELVGDEYIVNGQKIWTTDAQYADGIFALVRTDPSVKPQRGISFLLIDMKSAGISRRPIESIDGAHSLNEMFFDNVRVHAENLIGEAGKGWDYAKFLLTHERSASAEVPHTQRDLDQLKTLAGQARKNGKPLLDDPLFRSRVAALEIAVMALEWSVLRVLHAPDGDGSLNTVASVLKIRGSQLRQQVAELSAEALGDYSTAMFLDPEDPDVDPVDRMGPPIEGEAEGVTARALFRRATSIYGGANEIQRGIIAKSILGL